MNIATVVGLLLCLISCLHLHADGATARGKTKDCSKHPEGWENICHRYLCDSVTGIFNIHTCGKTVAYCDFGEIAEPGEENLDEPYPKCCATPYCRKL